MSIVSHPAPPCGAAPPIVLDEVEVSITERCTLACHGCGFVVPHQPSPAIGDPVVSHARTLERLDRAGVRIRSLAILGGEASLVPERLSRAVHCFRTLASIERIEVVTNGLTPRGIPVEVLRGIDRLTVSVYRYSDALLDGWRAHVRDSAPSLELVFRHGAEGWDSWDEVPRVDDARATEIFARCWYRRHCVTVERDRLFVCSRIPKLGRDDEGLLVHEHVRSEEIRAYLGRCAPLPSCATCGPMLSDARIEGGIQPDARIERLERAALGWFEGDRARRRLTITPSGGAS